MKTRAVTLSMPVELHWQLRTLVGAKKMSRFVCNAVREKISDEKDHLRHAYRQAEKDRSRKKTIGEWSLTEGEYWK